MLQRPLTQVHHIRSLVDPHHTVRRAGGQHQAHVFRGKLHISHRGSTVHQCGSLYLKQNIREYLGQVLYQIKDYGISRDLLGLAGKLQQN